MWTFGWASHPGTAHEGECQDFAHACLIGDGSIWLGLVADGAGSAECGRMGAECTCTSFANSLEQALASGQELSRTLLEGVFVTTIEAVRDLARKEGKPFADFSSTLVGAALHQKEGFFFQIGDGAAAYRMANDYAVATWPSETEFVNTTHFVTSAQAPELFQVRRIAGTIEEVFLFTDGLQYLVLDFKDLKPHERFFHSVSEQLEAGHPGESEYFSMWIEALLKAPAVISRTDDDTSLVFARRAMEALCPQP
jgi:serine/threonine protein phosphatase PrpC